MFVDFSYSWLLDAYLRNKFMHMDRGLTHTLCNLEQHRLFTKSKSNEFSWLFLAYRCSPRRRSICARAEEREKYLYPSVEADWTLV